MRGEPQLNESIEISDLQALQTWITSWSQKIKPQQVIALQGEMGAGKTQTIRYLVEALGGASSASPTYAIHNAYQLNSMQINHVDLYRLQDDQDIESTGFWELFEQENSIVAIEWIDRLDANELPMNWDLWWIHFVEIEGQRRKIEIKYWESLLPK